METHGKESRNEELEFLRNCEENNLDGVRDCLSRSVDVNTVSEDGHWSGLTIAAEENYPELLEILLSHPDIEINKTTKYHNILLDQWTGLMIACEAGNSSIVSRLVEEEGLDINYQDEMFGNTAAHMASYEGHTECVRILAETGRVDWNKRSKWGRTPLLRALLEGHSDIVDIIVQQPNIDYNVKAEDGDTLAQAAVWGGNVKCVETLTAQESFDCWNVPDYNGNTPIMWAAKKEEEEEEEEEEYNDEIVEILLRCPRVDLDVVDADKKHLEELTKNKVILDQLWCFRSVQQRMILRDSLLTRQAGSVSSLQSLSRDAVLLILSTNNTQERLVTPLVDRLEGEITRRARELLLAPHCEKN